MRKYFLLCRFLASVMSHEGGNGGEIARLLYTCEPVNCSFPPMVTEFEAAEIYFNSDYLRIVSFVSY